MLIRVLGEWWFFCLHLKTARWSSFHHLGARTVKILDVCLPYTLWAGGLSVARGSTWLRCSAGCDECLQCIFGLQDYTGAIGINTVSGWCGRTWGRLSLADLFCIRWILGQTYTRDWTGIWLASMDRNSQILLMLQRRNLHDWVWG